MHTIRAYTHNDTNNVSLVLYESGLAKTVYEAQNMLLHELHTGHEYFVAEHEQTIVGIVSGRQHGLYRHGLYELYHIGVLPEHTGAGVAKDLFATLISHAQSLFALQGHHLRKFFLLSGERNIRAHAFYRKMGMEQHNTLRDHFAFGRNELVFDILFNEENKKSSGT